MSWIASSACTGPWLGISPPSDVTAFEQVQEWIAYILFAQCPQHIIASIIHILFLVSFAAHMAMAKNLQKPISFRSRKLSAGFIATLSMSTCFSVISLALVPFTVWDIIQYGHTNYAIRELVFVCLEAIAWIASVAILCCEAMTCAPKHGYTLRIWWSLVWILSLFELLSSIFRLVAESGLKYNLLLEVEDIYAIVKFPVSAYVAYKAVYALTGIRALVEGGGGLEFPLLKQAEGSIATSGFAVASFFSKVTLSWLTPVLVAGSKHSIELNDVPELAPGDTAQSMFNLLKKNWPQEHSCTYPMTLTVLKSFWLPIVYTGLLQFIRSFVMFGGPLLIPSFTSYAQGVYITRYDGYVLVILLFLAKTVEVITYHQFNFLSYKLGNNIRTGIVTMLYQKALRLSCSSRQLHGVGQITNYMVVDAQQISDACLQLHIIWAVPLQIAIAIVALFYVLGLSSAAGLVVLVLVAVMTGLISNNQKHYQIFLMKSRDTRMKAIIETLSYIKVIKLQAWEEKFRKRVEDLREEEYGFLTKFVISAANNMFILWNTQPVVSTITYAAAVWIGTPLSTSIIFTAASIFRIVQAPIRNFPQSLVSMAQILVSFQRLDKFMLSTELQEGAISKHLIVDDFPVVVEDGSFAWNEGDTRPTISGVNLKVTQGSLVTIVGTVGSGKSSLLSALLGEMVKLCGKAKTSGSIAYVAQNAWIQNATIEDNILFGAAKDSVRYDQVLHACALVQDLESMDHGDQTEIGEKGINLSGGQKQRIQLARAVYRNSDIYLLDDVFSAVDAHTGSHLFKECIRGILHGKTILLVTHQVEFLAGADLVLVMKDGRISQAGRYEEILTEGSDFAALVAAHNQAMDLVHTDKDASGTSVRRVKELSECVSFTRVVSTERSLDERMSFGSTDGLIETFPSASSADFKEGGTSKLIEAEQRETGTVSLRVYILYLTKAYGWIALVTLLVNQAIWQALLLWSDFWISEEIPEDVNQSYDSTKFIVVYIILNAVSVVAVLIRVLIVAAIGLKTSQLFFLEMLQNIVRAPMSFFDTTPSGRILSRFSSDQTNLDFTLHFFLGGLLGTLISAVGSIIVICISAWPIIVFIIPLAFLYKWFQDFYLTSSREITRLDSITKAPLIYHFSETVAGIETIRCFSKEEEFVHKNFQNLNSNMKMDFNNNSANEWLGLRLEGIGAAILSLTGLLFVVLPANVIKSDFVGLALSYALGLNTVLFWTVWLTCTVENKMVSVERVRQFTTIPSEADLVIKNCLQTPDWPTIGKIVSTRLKLRYRPSTPLVLKGVTFTIEGGHKVGVVGRTGSGKSTLLLAIFRLVEPVGGQITIDDVDISHLGLHDLRSRLGIIPQEPVLFEGTLRMNLDPFGSYSDDEIWRVLQKCQLDKVIGEKPEKLDALVTEYGGNWSVGQRQLLCFGRALLKHSKVLFLDEATASVDAQTDGIIQELIKKEFHNCTVISIAHRIPTVMDADRVLVMEAGRVKEFDSPSTLLSNSSTLFSSLVSEYKTRSRHAH
eukprot:c24855_g1_i1 orf=298-4842(-)